MSNDLKYDAERDLRDIGANKIEVYPLNKVRFKYHVKEVALNIKCKKKTFFEEIPN